ncbi:hypothetical protein BLOT_000539 [Blomia tropicalis]|nr:hypothetical protein BLOT_000539 [Blomia tropicalis]
MKPNIHIQVIVYENDKRRPFSQGYQCNYLNLEIEGLLNTSTGPINNFTLGVMPMELCLMPEFIVRYDSYEK